MLEVLTIDAQALVGLHGFPATLQHQSFKIVAAGGSLVFPRERSEYLGEELVEVVAGGSGGVGFVI